MMHLHQGLPIGTPMTNGGGKGSAPASPDYVGAANATAAGNVEAARATAAANRTNQVTPYGNLTYTANPGKDPYGNTLYTATQTLSPEQEARLQKEKEQVLIMSKIQTKELSNDAILTYLEKNYQIDMSKYPQEVKQKMVEEVQMIFEKFKNFDENMIPKLKEMRESMSF